MERAIVGSSDEDQAATAAAEAAKAAEGMAAFQANRQAMEAQLADGRPADDAAGGARPEWLPEKFKSPEDMAAAYAELERKASGGTPKEAAAETDAAESEETTPSGSVDLPALEAEYLATGKLSDDSYAKLEAQGIPRSVADNYIQMQNSAGQKLRADAAEVAGGEQQLSAMLEWAKTGLSKAEAEAFNALGASGSTPPSVMIDAVRKLHGKYVAATGAPANLIQGDTPPASASTDVYRSTHEVVEAMSHPKYATDPAYRAAVQQKLGRSDVFRAR